MPLCASGGAATLAASLVGTARYGLGLCLKRLCRSKRVDLRLRQRTRRVGYRVSLAEYCGHGSQGSTQMNYVGYVNQ